MRVSYDEKLVDDELLRLLIEENKSDEVIVRRQIEEMATEGQKSSDLNSLIARLQHKFKHVIDVPIIALVGYNEDECVAQLAALTTSASLTRVETAEQFLQSIFPQYDSRVLTSCFTEQGKDLSKTIEELLSLEVGYPYLEVSRVLIRVVCSQ